MNAGGPAIVLRRIEYGESDLIVSLLARDHGKLSALARAGRKSQRRFGGALGLTTVSEVELSRRPGSEMWTLATAKVTRVFASIPADVAAFAHASYAIELVRELSPPEVPEPDVFDLAVELFETVEARGPTAFVLRAFEAQLLDAVGLRPVWERCAACGRETELSLLDPNRGGAICRTCSAGSRGIGVRPLSAAARRILVAAAGSTDLATAAASASAHTGDGAGEARDAMLAVLLHHIGKPLKTVEFIAKLGAGP